MVCRYGSRSNYHAETYPADSYPRYCEGPVSALVAGPVTLLHSTLHAADFCIIVHGMEDKGLRSHHPQHGEPNNERIWPALSERSFNGFLRVGSNSLSGAPSQKQETMLVLHIESVESAEQIIPARVWFDRLEKLHSRLPHALYCRASNLSFEFLGSFGNRELGVTVRDLSVSENKLTNQYIKGGSQIVDNIPNDSSESRWNLRRNDRSIDNR